MGYAPGSSSLVPPLTTSALEVTEAIEILDEALTAAR